MAKTLLRSPPFPLVRPSIGCVAEVRPTCGHAAIDAAKLHHLLLAISSARVGGDFWGRQVGLAPGVRFWAYVESRADAAALVAHPVNAHSTVLTFPSMPGTRRERYRLRRAGYTVLPGAVDPWHLLAQVEAVVLPAKVGEAAVLALAAQLPCVTLRDMAPAPLSSLRQTAWERLVAGVRYRDPFTGRSDDTVDSAIAHLSYWREQLARNRGFASATAMAYWKRRTVRQMLWDGSTTLRFRSSATAAIAVARRAGGKTAAWAAKAPVNLEMLAQQAGVPIVHVEDGFIRSIGLGSDCVPPQSIVVDSQRPHYDASGPSDLEVMIETLQVPAETLTLSRTLIDRIKAAGVGKYGAVTGRAPRLPAGMRRVVLVTGQVEDDASVRLGGANVDGNLDLLRRVRAMECEATIIYRPHPDVEAAHRVGSIADPEALRYADHVDRETPLATLLDHVDAVHVITSLAGFEALLRGKEVVTHGAPFYSGWGLTRDMAPITRRKRKITIETLFACAILHYPRYVDPRTMLPCPASVLIDRIEQGEQATVTLLTRIRRLRRLPVIRQVLGE